jgi:hypothetical protein
LAAAAKAAMARKAPVASITPIKQEQAASSITQGKRKSPDTSTHKNNDTALAATVRTGKTNDDSIAVDDDSDLDETPKQADPSLLKGDHGLQIIVASEINRHLILSELDLKVIQLMLEPNTPKEQYRNGIHFLVTVLTITEATNAVMNLLPGLQTLGHRKDVRSIDVIGFLTNNSVTILPITGSYEAIMTMDHASPVIIEYSVTRHPYENLALPASWTQFCLLYKKEKLLIPFNESGFAISLGTQFTNTKWTFDFDHYCKNNLNYRIAPVDRFNKPGPPSLVRGLNFNGAWTITMPPVQPN